MEFGQKIFFVKLIYLISRVFWPGLFQIFYLPITTSSSVLSCPIHSNLKLFKVCDSLRWAFDKSERKIQKGCYLKKKKITDKMMIEWFKYLFDAISHCAARLAVPDVKFPSKIMPFPVQTQSFFAWSYNT